MITSDTEKWLEFSANDLIAARFLSDQERKQIEIIIFHCQQSAEKALKAVLVENGQLPPKTHDLALLRSLCLSNTAISSKMMGSRFVGHCNFLNNFSVIVRYPLHNFNLDSSHMKRGLNSAERIFITVCNILGCGQRKFLE